MPVLLAGANGTLFLRKVDTQADDDDEDYVFTTINTEEETKHTPRRRSFRPSSSQLPDIAVREDKDDRDGIVTEEIAPDLNILLEGEDASDYELMRFVMLSFIDEDEKEESDHKRQVEMALNEAFIHEVGGYDVVMSGEINSDALREMSVTGWTTPAIVDVDVDAYLQEPYISPTLQGEYPGLKESYYGPGPVIKRKGDSPLALSLFFMPVSLWNEIASQPNLYPFSMINERAKARYVMHKKKKPKSAKTQGGFKAAMMQLPPILTKTFKNGFVTPPRVSFVEGMLPSFSPYNKTRVYMKVKPHKWGTKMFLTCCAESAHCLRCEIYVGQKKLQSERRSVLQQVYLQNSQLQRKES
ncbi:hypothetical protein PHPALM_4026 [Phytophthora palmivora]|uniref:PiggyBac transposable element-derived protein domain-containing protein n=1 Tax=Phytophthora palmivora TaxID=4796 RepID=A0A2P4YKX5_9STRA|nr:hypothetical protein PHPALM_4026 [Phytophthora palmivora]